MRKFALTAIAACFLGAPAVMAGPIPSAGITTMSSDDGLVFQAAYHSHKNMTRVHKKQGMRHKM